MTRKDFIKALQKLGACEGGVLAAKASIGPVSTVAKAWAKSDSRSTTYLYFRWLKGIIKCRSGDSRCYTCTRLLTKVEYNKMRKIVSDAES